MNFKKVSQNPTTLEFANKQMYLAAHGLLLNAGRVSSLLVDLPEFMPRIPIEMFLMFPPSLYLKHSEELIYRIKKDVSLDTPTTPEKIALIFSYMMEKGLHDPIMVGWGLRELRKLIGDQKVIPFMEGCKTCDKYLNGICKHEKLAQLDIVMEQVFKDEWSVMIKNKRQENIDLAMGVIQPRGNC